MKEERSLSVVISMTLHEFPEGQCPEEIRHEKNCSEEECRNPHAESGSFFRKWAADNSNYTETYNSAGEKVQGAHHHRGKTKGMGKELDA